MAESLIYREHQPLPRLRAYVQCLWELEGSGTDSQLIVPDGCMELVLNFAAAFERIDGPAARQPRTLFVGELRRPVTTRPTGRVSLLGVRFRPGAARVFLDASVNEVVDHLADEAPLAKALAQQVRAVHDAEARDRIPHLQRALLDQLHRRPQSELSVRAAQAQ